MVVGKQKCENTGSIKMFLVKYEVLMMQEISVRYLT